MDFKNDFLAWQLVKCSHQSADADMRNVCLMASRVFSVCLHLIVSNWNNHSTVPFGSAAYWTIWECTCVRYMSEADNTADFHLVQRRGTEASEEPFRVGEERNTLLCSSYFGSLIRLHESENNCEDTEVLLTLGVPGVAAPSLGDGFLLQERRSRI